MSYIIKRIDGAYVARSGSEHSYTTKLQHAQTYRTRESAQNDLCVENERIVSLEDEMRAGGAT